MGTASTNRRKRADLLFCGDFAPVRRFEPIALAKGGAIFGDLQPHIASADFAIVNVEAPLCSPGRPNPKSGPHLRADPRCADALAEAGFRVAGLANNHCLDYGERGLRETRDTLRATGLKTCGADLTRREAEEAAVITANGLRVAIVAVAEQEFNAASENTAGAAIVSPIDTMRQIRDAALRADAIIVSLHAGNELYPLPRPGLKKLCRFLIDCGAHAVVCHHTHVPGPIETYKERPICYGLGNLIFDRFSNEKEWADAYAAKISVLQDPHGSTSIECEFIPYTQTVETFGIRLKTGDELSEFHNMMTERASVVSDDQALRAAWKTYCMSNEFVAIAGQYLPFRFPGMRRVASVIPFHRLFSPRHFSLERLNKVRCESHREFLITVLENQC